MIFINSYHNVEHKQTINSLVGKPFNFLATFKMKGIISKRIMIDNFSSNMQIYMNTTTNINYANIELRQHGILVYINTGLTNYVWAVPYYQLIIYHTNELKLHAQEKFIHFKNNKTYEKNEKFINKMLDKKAQYDKKHNFLSIT